MKKVNMRKLEIDKLIQPDFVKKEREQKLNYPYIVISCAGVYRNMPVDFVVDESESAYRNSIRIVIPEPCISGVLTEEARTAVVAVALHIVNTSGLRACAVFSEDDCVFCEKDGVMNESKIPPNGNLNFEELIKL